MKLTPQQRFNQKINYIGAIHPEFGQCWEWTARRTKKGYGVFRFDGPKLAHRVAWLFAFGEIPEGLGVLHKCDNRACVRPAHFFLGTNADNTADMVSKGRQRAPSGKEHWAYKNPPRGITNSFAKLTVEEVLAIRSLCAAGETQSTVAARFGVTRGNIGHIVRRVSWSHI